MCMCRQAQGRFEHVQVWDLIEYLRSQFAKAANFQDKQVEITCLLVTFAFEKMFVGCINKDKINRIGAPLVWKHTWSDELNDVVVHYKYSLADEATFLKDEWGPWQEEMVHVNNSTTGQVCAAHHSCTPNNHTQSSGLLH